MTPHHDEAGTRRPDPTDIETAGTDPVGADPVGADPVGADPVGADPVGAETGGAETGGAETGGAGTGGTETAGARTADRGSITPLIVGCTLLAGLLVTAVTAASAAFLAQRDLAGTCDGAAVAAAAAGTVPGPDGTPVLEPAAVVAAIERYRAEVAGDDPYLVLDAGTDGRTVTVVCATRTRIPSGAGVGAPDGLDRTVVARAAPVTR